MHAAIDVAIDVAINVGNNCSDKYSDKCSNKCFGVCIICFQASTRREQPKNKHTVLLDPSGALVLMMVHYIYNVQLFSDFEHLCLSILLQVSL